MQSWNPWIPTSEWKSLQSSPGRVEIAYGGLNRKRQGKAPLGYRWHEKRLIADDNADIVAGAWKEYMKEQSTLKLRDYFQQHGIKISQPGTLGLLKNDFYVGMVRYGDVEEKGGHEPLVNMVVFGKVQAQLKRNRRG